MGSTEWVDIMVASICDDEDDDDLLLRRLIPCEEDRRRLFPTTTWTGGYRWFRSPNVIDLEAYRSTCTRS
jgi:hypothetical protein